MKGLAVGVRLSNQCYPFSQCLVLFATNSSLSKFTLGIQIFVVYFTFLVTKTKIRNRKAVFQADSPIKGSRDLAW